AELNLAGQQHIEHTGNNGDIDHPKHHLGSAQAQAGRGACQERILMGWLRKWDQIKKPESPSRIPTPAMRSNQFGAPIMRPSPWGSSKSASPAVKMIPKVKKN